MYDAFLYYLFSYVYVVQVLPFVTISRPKPCINLSFPPYAYYALPNSFSFICSPNNFWLVIKIMKFLIMQISLATCSIVILRSKYLTQHPILEQKLTMCFPKGEKQDFTQTQNNRQNNDVANFNF